jgi:hypothetical protein
MEYNLLNNSNYRKFYERMKSVYQSTYDKIKYFAKSKLESSLGDYSKEAVMAPSMAYMKKLPQQLNLIKSEYNLRK